MDPLLLLAIEADKEAKRKSKPVCHADGVIAQVKDSLRDLGSSVSGIESSITELAKEVSQVSSVALQAVKEATKKAPPVNYVMDVERGENEKISKIYVKAVKQ